MASQHDLALGRLAVEAGLITREQFEAILAEQAADPKPLGVLLIRRGWLNDDALRDLLGRIEAAGGVAAAPPVATPRRTAAVDSSAPPGPPTRKFGEILVEKNAASDSQIRRVTEEQAKLRAASTQSAPRLGEMLVQKGVITPGQVQDALAEQKKALLVCSLCGMRYNVRGYEAKKTYRCKTCQGLLVVPPAGGSVKADESAFGINLASQPDVPSEVIHAGKDPANHFNKYIIVRELGRGGMGVVHLAWQKDLGRFTALKALARDSGPGSSAGGAEADIRRFRQEAATAARLHHPNIAPIYEVGEHNGQLYYTMAYIRGEPLDAAIERKALPLKRGIEILRDVALAVDYAHREGVVHRDLKPSNILIDGDGKPWVLDFGLAQTMQKRTKLTISGEVVGTPAHMSPEQARGHRGQVDAVSDVFSLGTILYEVMTGRPAFAGRTSMEIMLKVVTKDPPRASQSNPRVNVDLDTICLKALEKEKKNRYRSARALAEDLHRYLNGQPILARAPGAFERIARGVRAHPVPTAVVAVAIFAIAGAGAVILTQEDPEAARLARVETALAEADMLFVRKEFEKAQEAYARVLALDPENRRARERRDGYEKSKKASAMAREADGLRAIADELFESGDYMGALQYYVRALDRRPDDRTSAARKAECENRIEAAATAGATGEGRKATGEAGGATEEGGGATGEPVVTTSQASSSVSSVPSPPVPTPPRENPDPMPVKGGAVAALLDEASGFAKAGKRGEARVAYEKALDLDPSSRDARIALSTLLRAQAGELLSAGRPKDAEPLAERACALDPQSAVAAIYLGLARRGQGDLDGAVRHLTRAIELNPTYYAPYDARGAIYRQRRDLEWAKNDYTKVARLTDAEKPHVPATAFLDRAMTKFLMDDLDGAAGDCEKAFKKLRGPEGTGILGWIRAREGKTDEAAKLARESQALNDKKFWAFLVRAELARRAGKYDEGLHQIQGAEARVTDDDRQDRPDIVGWIFALKADLLEARKDAAGAKKALAELKGIDPRNPRVTVGNGVPTKAPVKQAPSPAKPPVEPVRRFSFNGRDLSGFYTFLRGRGRGSDPEGVFGAADGILRIRGGEKGYLGVEGDRADYRLTIEYQWGKETHGDRKGKARDSGVIVHASGPDPDGDWPTGFECQILEGRTGDLVVKGASIPFDESQRPRLAGKLADDGSRQINGVRRRSVPSPDWKDEEGHRGPGEIERPAGEWNRLEITADGDRLVFVLNGTTMQDVRGVEPARGRVLLLSQGAELLVRKFEIAPLR